ncbi:MAG: M23 family metallopeptidase [Rhodovibrionaceae bacterium]
MRLPALVLVFALAAVPALADCTTELAFEGDFIQGGLVRGSAPAGSRIYLDGAELRVGETGRFVMGFGRDHPGEARLWVICPYGRDATLPLRVAAREYNIQRIDGLPPKYVEPPAEVTDRIRLENETIAAARRLDTPAPLFESGFVWPAQGRISGVYGSQRILNGAPKRPHYGVDIAAPLGTAVRAPAAGIVRLAEEDLYYTGGTIVLDHGYGLSSAFLHLQRLKVIVGQQVAQGEIIATLGDSGRATGPHLDWRVNWFEERLDPALLAGPFTAQTSSSQ